MWTMRKSVGVYGIVRYVGHVQRRDGITIGIELYEPHGNNDGEIGGVRYFRCPRQHGVFARPEHCVSV